MELQTTGGVAVLPMRAGKANAIGSAFLDRLSAQLDAVESSHASALVLTGEGTAFSAGLDLPEVVALDRGELERFIRRFSEVMLRVFTLPVPVVAAINGHAIALAARDEKFRRIFESADIIHADGQAAVFASRLLTGTPIPERSATTDFIHDAAKLAARYGLRFFLLGATEEANAEAARILEETYPGLKIGGRRHGYFSSDEEEAICEEINASGADVVWLGLSMPLEYEFAARNKHRLDAGWIVTCGGCFNFLSGDYVRAPDWMQRID